MHLIPLTPTLAAKSGLLACLALSWCVPAHAQVAAPAGTTSTISPAAPHMAWGALSDVQKLALAPLSGTWSSLSDGQRRKWIAIAQSFPNLTPADQQKLHSRMVEWAALTPKDRALARLNFAQTKAVAKPDRAANWEAYQALTDEEKKNLAASVAVKPTGAALAPKPVSKDKLTPVPVTRHTPEEQKAAAAPKTPLNRNTLLPQAPSNTSDAPRKSTPSQP